MLAPMILVAAMAVPSGVADGPQGPGTQLVLEVSAKPIHPDGRQTGRASSNDPSSFTNEFVYAGETPCTLGASASERTITTPGNGWRVSGRVLRHEDGGLFVQLDWQRQWYQSQKIADGLGGSQQVSIKTGDTLALDEIYVTPNAACDAVGVRLEASVVERPVPPPTARMRGGVGMSSGAVAGATGAGAAGAGTATGEQGRLVNPAGNVASAGRAGVGARGGAGVGARGGAGVGTGGGAAVGTGGGAGVGMGGGTGVETGEAAGSGSSGRLGFGPGIASLAQPVEVELFLVHTRADGSEETHRLRTPASPVSNFRFPEITVRTSEGDATYQVGGAIAAVIDVTGEKQLRVVIERKATGGAGVGGGQSLGAYQMPGPGDVYSFEIPAPRVKGRDVKSDRLSIRVRLVAKRD